MFRVLDAAVASEQAQWLNLWAAWPSREVHAHPAYVKLFARPNDRVVCAADGDDEGGVLYPMILRPIRAEPWAATGEDVWDAVSPYGYGGPFAWGSKLTLAESFWAGYEDWARAQSIITSFARLSLFPDQLLPFHGEVVNNMPNVVRRLDLPLDEIWSEYAHKVRKNVNKARRCGLSVEFDQEGARLDTFMDIYRSTMDRRGAAQSFYFPREFFDSIIDNLLGQFVFAHVLSEGDVVSTELVLLSEDHIYSFLGGTLPSAFDLRPNDLLKHSVVEWGHQQGKTSYVLGGGYGGEDGIFKYKLSFAPSGKVSFRVGQTIHSAVVYQKLLAMRADYESAHDATWSPRGGFFPKYRA